MAMMFCKPLKFSAVYFASIEERRERAGIQVILWSVIFQGPDLRWTHVTPTLIPVAITQSYDPPQPQGKMGNVVQLCVKEEKKTGFGELGIISAISLSCLPGKFFPPFLLFMAVAPGSSRARG